MGVWGVLSVRADGGGVENIPFLQTNAAAAAVSAIFWLEKIKQAILGHYWQLQYVQSVLLNFPIIAPDKPPVPFSWPHVSIATLHKTFPG